jgi:hypothetical protein
VCREAAAELPGGGGEAVAWAGAVPARRQAAGHGPAVVVLHYLFYFQRQLGFRWLLIDWGAHFSHWQRYLPWGSCCLGWSRTSNTPSCRGRASLCLVVSFFHCILVWWWWRLVSGGDACAFSLAAKVGREGRARLLTGLQQCQQHVELQEVDYALPVVLKSLDMALAWCGCTCL